jgi:RNA polymerase sigma-70 factor (sigma-E family)
MGSPEEPESFEAFMRARSAGLMRYAYVLTGSQHDAADLVQEALVRLGVVWKRVRGKGDPERYVRTIMARLHVSWWRRRRRELLVSSVPEQPSTDDGLARAEIHSGLIQSLSALPPRQRAVLVLRYYEHHSDDEIAAALGISRGTVRSQAARGLAKLRAVWMPATGTTDPGGARMLARRQR